MKLETLIVTMNRTNVSIIEDMNVEGCAVIANQCSYNDVVEYKKGNYTIKMVSTNTRGVGLNRNIAIAFSSADILLFADDDVVYNAGYAENVIKAYEKNPDADMIIFGMVLKKDGKITRIVKNKNKRIGFFEGRKFGGVVISVKRTSLLAHNVCFNQLFGGGCIYSCGEDTLFILNCIKSGMRTYTDSYVLGETNKDESSWFNGYDEKYFYDKGAWIKAAFTKITLPVKVYYAIKMKNRTDLSLFTIMKLMLAGFKGYKSTTAYDVWKDGIEK